MSIMRGQHMTTNTTAFATRTMLPSVTLLLLALALAPSASAQPKPSTPAERAVVRHADDKDLEWGPAPAFMPKGTQLTVLHGDPAKHNADVLLKVPPKTALPSHWHTSAERMILIAGELHVTYVGQEKQVMKAGSYAYGPAKLRHDATCASNVPCVLFIAFELPVDAVPSAPTAPTSGG